MFERATLAGEPASRPVHSMAPVRRTVLILAVTLALFAALALPAAAALSAGRGTGPALEPLTAYQPQTTCSPWAKPGTLAFARMLLRAYPRTRSLGIVRACRIGGRSEHKEGRAFDWGGLRASSPVSRAWVAAVCTWLFRKDRYGHPYAMARRLGIMYIIWNRHIWSANGLRPGWQSYYGPNPHIDHVHFSFNWPGARKVTSYWTGRVAVTPTDPPPPRPKPTPTHKPTPSPTPTATPTPSPTESPSPTATPTDTGTPTSTATPMQTAARAGLAEPSWPRTLPSGPALGDETVWVPPTAAGAWTAGALQAGQRYYVEVRGTWSYARTPGSIADGECSLRPGSPAWWRNRSLVASQPTADHLDLYLNGIDPASAPDTRPNGGSCDWVTHTYRWYYTPTRTGRVNLRVWDPASYADNAGGLRVRLLHLTAPARMSWPVPAGGPAGTMSPGLVVAGQRYVATIIGTYTAGGGVVADAVCASAGTGPWRPAVPTRTAGALVDKADPEARAARPDPGNPRCDSATHTYLWTFVPTRTGLLNLRVADRVYGDIGGSLTVTVVRDQGTTR